MFGLMRKSTHRKIYIEQGQAYRKQFEDQQYEINHLKSQLRGFTDKIIHDIHMENEIIPHDRLILMVEVSGERLRRMLKNDLAAYIQDRIMERLLEFDKDYRPDMRQQIKNERLILK